MAFRQILFLAALALSFPLTRLPAAVIVSGVPGQPGGFAQLTQNFTLGVATADSAAALAFVNWVPVADSEQTLAVPAAGSEQLSYQINGGPVQTVGIEGLVDNYYQGTEDDLTATDGFFYFSSPLALPSGSTITFVAQTIDFESIPSSFNPAAIQTFTGQAWLIDPSAVALTDQASVGSVPEPGTSALLLGGAGILLRRRKRRTGTD